MGARIVSENDLMKLAEQGYKEYEADGSYFLYAAPNITLEDNVNVSMRKFLGLKLFNATGISSKLSCQFSKV